MKKILALATLIALPATAASAADVAHGQTVFKQCAVCHNFKAGAGPKIGPNLWGVVGRKAGTAPGFDGYSDAMRHSGIVWDAKTLNVFLENPMKAVPGTAMGYAGVKDPKERADLIAWLRQATQPGKTCRLSD